MATVWKAVGRTAVALFIIGAALFVAGVVVLDEDLAVAIAEALGIKDVFYIVTLTMVVVGLIVILVAILGSVADHKDIRWLAILYITLVIITLSVIFCLSVWALAEKNKFIDIAVDKLKKSVKNYPDGIGTKSFVNFIQEKLDCCGSTHGIKDFTGVVPESCKPAHNTTACVGPTRTWVSGKLDLFGSICLALDGFMITALLIAVYYDKICASCR